MIVILSKKPPYMLKKAFSEIKAKNIKNFVFICEQENILQIIKDKEKSLLLFSNYPIFLSKKGELIEFNSSKDIIEYIEKK